MLDCSCTAATIQLHNCCKLRVHCGWRCMLLRTQCFNSCCCQLLQMLCLIINRHTACTYPIRTAATVTLRCCCHLPCQQCSAAAATSQETCTTMIDYKRCSFAAALQHDASARSCSCCCQLLHFSCCASCCTGACCDRAAVAASCCCGPIVIIMLDKP